MSAGCTEAQIRRRALQPLASVSCVWASPINRSLPPPHTIRSYSPQSHDYVQHFAWLAQKQSVQYSSLILLCYIGFILSFILREDKCLSSLNKNKQEDVTFLFSVWVESTYCDIINIPFINLFFLYSLSSSSCTIVTSFPCNLCRCGACKSECCWRLKPAGLHMHMIAVDLPGLPSNAHLMIIPNLSRSMLAHVTLCQSNFHCIYKHTKCICLLVANSFFDQSLKQT